MVINVLLPAPIGYTTEAPTKGAAPKDKAVVPLMRLPASDTTSAAANAATGTANVPPGAQNPVLEDASPIQTKSLRPHSATGASLQLSMRLSASLEALFVTIHEGLHDGMTRKGQQQELQRENVRKAAEQADKEAKASNIDKIFGWIVKAFSVLAVGAAVIGGILTGGALMVAAVALIIAVWDVVASATKERGGPDMSISAGVAALARLDGCSKEKAAEIGNWFSMALTIALAAFGAGASAVASAAGTASALAKSATSVLNVTSALAAGGSAAVRIDHAKLGKDLAYTEAEGLLNEKTIEVTSRKINMALQNVQLMWDQIMAAVIITLDISEQQKRSQQTWAQNI